MISDPPQDEGAGAGGVGREFDQVPSVLAPRVQDLLLVTRSHPGEDLEHLRVGRTKVISRPDVQERPAKAGHALRIVDAVARPQARPREADPAVDLDRRAVLHHGGAPPWTLPSRTPSVAPSPRARATAASRSRP